MQTWSIPVGVFAALLGVSERRQVESRLGRQRSLAPGYPRSMRTSFTPPPRQRSRSHPSRAFGRYASHIEA